jgi:hypothetical protein
MLRTTVVAAAVVFAASAVLAGAAVGGEGAPAEDRRVMQLALGGTTEVNLLGLERPAVYEIVCKGKRMVFRAFPDGLTEFQRADISVSLKIEGAEGAKAELNIRRGEQVSVWPIRRLEIRGRAYEFGVKATAADWAFVVSAERTTRAGIRVRCDGTQATLRTGQRLDTDLEGDEIVFRVTGREWPGEIVEAPKPPTVKPKPRPPIVVEGPVPPLPILAVGWVSWEVKPARPVTP